MSTFMKSDGASEEVAGDHAQEIEVNVENSGDPITAINVDQDKIPFKESTEDVVGDKETNENKEAVGVDSEILTPPLEQIKDSKEPPHGQRRKMIYREPHVIQKEWQANWAYSAFMNSLQSVEKFEFICTEEPEDIVVLQPVVDEDELKSCKDDVSDKKIIQME